MVMIMARGMLVKLQVVRIQCLPRSRRSPRIKMLETPETKDEYVRLTNPSCEHLPPRHAIDSGILCSVAIAKAFGLSTQPILKN